jgi:hypothetical protein
MPSILYNINIFLLILLSHTVAMVNAMSDIHMIEYLQWNSPKKVVPTSAANLASYPDTYLYNSMVMNRKETERYIIVVMNTVPFVANLTASPNFANQQAMIETIDIMF